MLEVGEDIIDSEVIHQSSQATSQANLTQEIVTPKSDINIDKIRNGLNLINYLNQTRYNPGIYFYLIIQVNHKGQCQVIEIVTN